MKLLLKLIGAIFVLFVVFFISIAAYVSSKSSEYETTAVPFINELIPKLSTWDIEVFKEYSAPKLNKESSDADLSRLLKWFSKLGKLKSTGEPDLNGVKNGNILTYAIPVRYEAGEAIISLTIEDTEDGFLIHHFDLDSIALVE